MDILTLTFLIWNFIPAEGNQVPQKTTTITKTKRLTTNRQNHIAQTLSNFQAEGSPYKIPIYFEDIIYKPRRTNAHQSVNINHHVALTTTTARMPVTGPGVIKQPFHIQTTQSTFQIRNQVSKQSQKPIIRKFRIPVSRQPQNPVARTFRQPVSQQPQIPVTRTFRLPVSQQPQNPVEKTFRFQVSQQSQNTATRTLRRQVLQQSQNAVTGTFRLPVSQQPQNAIAGTFRRPVLQQPQNAIAGTFRSPVLQQSQNAVAGTFRRPVLQQPQNARTIGRQVSQQSINRRQVSRPTRNRNSNTNWRQWIMMARNQRINGEDGESNNWISTNNNRDLPSVDDFTSRSNNRWTSSRSRRRQQHRRSRNRNNRICSCMLYCESDYHYDGPCSSRAFPNFGNLMSRCCVTDFTSVWDENFFSFED